MLILKPQVEAGTIVTFRLPRRRSGARRTSSTRPAPLHPGWIGLKALGVADLCGARQKQLEQSRPGRSSWVSSKESINIHTRYEKIKLKKKSTQFAVTSTAVYKPFSTENTKRITITYSIKCLILTTLYPRSNKWTHYSSFQATDESTNESTHYKAPDNSADTQANEITQQIFRH
jgi:hypothetical protein